MQQNPKALEAVWDYAREIGIGYLGTNTPIDHCYACGFEGDFEPTAEASAAPSVGIRILRSATSQRGPADT